MKSWLPLLFLAFFSLGSHAQTSDPVRVLWSSDCDVLINDVPTDQKSGFCRGMGSLYCIHVVYGMNDVNGEKVAGSINVEYDRNWFPFDTRDEAELFFSQNCFR